jgi:pyruvate,orthophosphate dikinase
VKAKTGSDFPEEVKEQLLMSIKAVLRSWDNHRARAYRKMNNIQGLVGTAVNVQAMVFGNMGETSATGVAFSRDPSTGEKVVMGEYLINAQGEDVVAGIRTPNKIIEMQKSLPECYAQFMVIVNKLENHFRDMQDVEFTIQEGKLFFLQCRNGKRSAKAGIKIAVEMAQEGLLSQEEAILRVDPSSIT